ncbi:RNA polymerase sigma factor [Bacillus sp. J14TS2]|uniref:sigma-70 family RNA polymerase sigma factor n=1 Tax=Bacillus sp. J14TS2 TaxID=2807188 RepID=UPI001B05E3A3|nr:sigma-70 family RNA polymerase sigma factor [Bacillus sp. J14TS2]GIN71799.1 RNA polymerase sigma factor [Bacillus sp. J14TS2]
MDEKKIKQWITLILSGNEDYFLYLYDETCNDVYRTVRFLLIDQQDVEDVVSEVYLALWRSIKQYDSTRSFRFWLHGLIVRKSQDWRRQAWRRIRILERKKIYQQEEHLHDSETILHKETETELIQALATLSAKHREVIIMRFYHEYPLEEISVLLQIPLGTVKSRLHTALKRLKGKMEACVRLEAGEYHGF